MPGVDMVKAAVAGLNNSPLAVANAIKIVPRAAGLYAWWADPAVLPAFTGPANSTDPHVRLLYIGIATNLHNRITGDHLRRSGSSTLRRTLAGLLMAEELFQTTWTNRVVLIADDEHRLTAWMHANLRLTWFECAEPRQGEKALIPLLQPPLNVEGSASGAVRDLVKHAKDVFRNSVNL